MSSSENNFFQKKVAKRLLLANVTTAFVISACNDQIKYPVMRDNMRILEFAKNGNAGSETS